MNNHNLISIDLAKNVFQVCVMKNNKPVINKKVRRNKLLQSISQLDEKRIVMEACYSSNYWGREFLKMGFQVDLIPPHQVKPFVVGNKNDHNDAIAIAEAAQRPKVSLIRVKSLEQQDIQSLYRIRERLMRSRSAVANQLRGLLAEYGVVVEKKVATLRVEVPYILEDADNDLTVIARAFVQDLYWELIELDEKIEGKQAALKQLLSVRNDYQLLQSIPGFGPVVSGHLLAAVDDPRQFKNGRNLAAWIGVTPKQIASGDRSKMIGISKRGNSTLRKQLIHGARAVIRWCEGKDDKLSLWLQDLLKRKPKNKVVVALANKLARIAWAVLSTRQPFNLNKMVEA